MAKEKYFRKKIMDALIIVPCYNEEKRLPKEIFADFMEKHEEFSFLFVNDGSSDNTGKYLEELCKIHPNAEFLELPGNRGKAEAIRLGMLHAAHSQARFTGFFDADLATPLEELPAMIANAENDTLCISGCRLLRLGSRIKRSPLRHFIGRLFATAASIHLGLPVYDTQCGAKLYATGTIGRLFHKPFATRWFFDVEILRRMVRIYGKDQVIKKVLEYPLSCWEDKSGSKIRVFSALTDFIRLLLSKD